MKLGGKFVTGLSLIAVMVTAGIAADTTTATKILRGPLAGTPAQPDAKGLAEHRVVPPAAGSTAKPVVSIVIGVKGLKLADGTEVGFGVAGKPLGKVKVKGGEALLKLSTEKGDKIPPVKPGDEVGVVVDIAAKTLGLKGKLNPPPKS